MRDDIRKKLGVQYCDVYGLSEVMGPGVAMECAESHGLHVAEDHFYAEIVDPDTLEPVPDGTYGELVFTTLTRECCPLVRYRTRDVTRIITEHCSCGRTHRKIDRIVGRTDDMMIIRGVNVFPSQIEQVITGFPEIATQYQIVPPSNGPLDRIELAGGDGPRLPVRRDPQARGPQAPPAGRAQEQPADLRRHPHRRAQDHRAQRGQGEAHHRQQELEGKEA